MKKKSMEELLKEADERDRKIGKVLDSIKYGVLLIGAISIIFVLFFMEPTLAISSGKIHVKRYEPAKSWVSMMTMTTMSGKFTFTHNIPTFHHDDEDFIFELRREKDGKVSTNEIYVDKKTYNSHKIGDFYDGGKNPKTSDKAMTRKATEKEKLEMKKKSQGVVK